MGNDSSKMAEREAQLRMKRRGPLFIPRPHPIMDTGSLESFDSGVSLKSDQSKDSPFDFKDRVSPSWSDFSSSEEDDVSDDEDLVESPDDLRGVRRAQLCMLRQGFFGSDVSAVDDWINSLDDLMADREALRPMKRRGPLFIPRPLLSMDTGSLESFDSGVSLKSDQSKAGLIDFKDRVSPRWVDFSSSEKKHVVADDEGLVESPDDLRGVRRAQLRGERRALFCPCDLSHTPPHLRRAMQSLESIDSGVSLKSDRSKAEPFDFKDRVSPRDRLRKSHSSGIISASVRRKDSQGCTADVKDTPPSPKQKRAMQSLESIDSGVSLKSDRSKDRVSPRDRRRKSHSSGIISASVRRKDSQGCTADVKDTPPSPKEKMAERGAQLFPCHLFLPPPHLIMATGSLESIDSGVSLKSDQSKEDMTNFKDRVSPRRATGSLESSDSDVSLKSDQSKEDVINFKDRVSPRMAGIEAPLHMLRRAEEMAQFRMKRMPTRSKKSNGADVSKMSDSSIPVPLLPSQGRR